MNGEELKTWLAVILGALALLGHLKGYFSSGEKQLSDNLKSAMTAFVEAKEQIEDHERRIQTIETEMRHLPDSESQHRIELNLKDVSNRIDVLAERLEPLAAVTVRLQTYLLDQAKR